jgi:hypothetical protein
MAKMPNLADDLLDGCRAISRFTGLPEARLFYLMEQGYLPAFKLGVRWCARKSELRAALTSQRTSSENQQGVA